MPYATISPPRPPRGRAIRAATISLVLMLLAACAPNQNVQSVPVGKVWTPRAPQTPAPTQPRSPQPSGHVTDAIATVNGHPIDRRRITDLLIEAHGPGLLEQIIGLDEAQRLATRKGVTITANDIQREHDQALRRLVDPLAELTPDTVDLTAASQMLDALLKERNISRDEYDIVIRRNAVLRRIVESELRFTEQQIRAEYERSYGPRVQVRHIQLATAGEAARIADRLTAGDSFERLARTYSVNQASAAKGGLLAPFSESDDRVPGAFRKAAFRLLPGEVSDIVRTGQWHHLLLLEQHMPAGSVTLDEVRDQLVTRLKTRAAEPAMRERFEQLLREADIQIHDPVLQRAYQRWRPG